MFVRGGNKEVVPVTSIKTLMGTLDPEKNVFRRIGGIKVQFDEKEERKELQQE